jgi:hypothetical protein
MARDRSAIFVKPRSSFVYAFFVLAILIGLILLVRVGIVTGKELAGPLLAMLGTFLGALFAFRLNENKEQAKLENEQKAALNRALLVLARQRNAAALISRLLAPYKSRIELAINFPAHFPPSYSELVHKFDDLSFLLETGHANMLMRLTIEQERFHQMLECLRVRNEFYVNEVQPAIEQLSLNGKSTTGDQIAASLGERVFGGAMNGAEQVYDHVENAVTSLATMHTDLFAVAKKIFPHDPFVMFEMNGPKESSVPAA